MKMGMGPFISFPLRHFQRRRKKGSSWQLLPAREKFLRKQDSLFPAQPLTQQPSNKRDLFREGSLLFLLLSTQHSLLSTHSSPALRRNAQRRHLSFTDEAAIAFDIGMEDSSEPTFFNPVRFHGKLLTWVRF